MPQVVNGLAADGLTADRPTNAYPGFRFYDQSIGYALLWNGSQWEPMNTRRGTTAERPSASAVPAGALFMNTTTGLLQVSDGTEWVECSAVDNFSTSSSHSSSSSLSSEGNSSSSSTSSQSTSSSSTSSSQSSSS